MINLKLKTKSLKLLQFYTLRFALLAIIFTLYALHFTLVFAVSTDLSQKYAFGIIPNLGAGFQALVGPGFTIAALAVVIYLVVGAMRWIMSAGDKNAIASARGMIVHAIIGFILLMLMFLILQFIPQRFGFEGFRVIE